MLKLKPNCECCDSDLPPQSLDARTCSFECTFCKDCANEHFQDICPNCGGELLRRPIRPIQHLAKNPASTQRYLKTHPECIHPQSCGEDP